VTHTARYFALHGKRYNEIPPHGVNRQAAFGHEVWQIVDAQNRLILQARPANHGTTGFQQSVTPCGHSARCCNTVCTLLQRSLRRQSHRTDAL
jgi:hypothetical protein